MGIATAEIAIIKRKVLRRPRVSDSQPEKIRPEAFPIAPTRRVMVCNAVLGMPWLLAKGTSWLMTIKPAFWFMLVAYALGTSAGLMVISQLVPFARSQGIPSTALQTMTLLVGAIGNASGRIFSGWLSDTLGRLNTLRLMIAISAVAMPILYAVGSNVTLLYVMVFLVYYCYGTQLSVNASTTSDFWGTKNAGINYGLLFTAWGAAGIIGPRIGGKFFDKYHNYEYAFYTAAVLAAIALLCELAARRPKIPARA